MQSPRCSSADRLLNRDVDRLEDRLNAVIPRLPAVDESVARALAHVELAHVASTPGTRRLRNADARDAHQQALFLDPLTALWLQELEPGAP